MGLFGSLFTGVSSLFAQSQNTAIISNNIANINTAGFKRSEASFNSLVTTESRLSRYSPGTASVTRLQRVDQQGPIQQTSSGTDASISGNGFFPVKRSTDFGQEFLYTRAGQFSEDATGLLRNASGFVLYGWPIDSNGNLPADQGDLTSLVPVDVAFLGGLTRPTTSAELSINLDSDQVRTDYTVGADGLDADGAAQFSRGLTVFDALGSPQTVTLEFRHIFAPRSLTLSNQSGLELGTDLSFYGAVDGDTLVLNDGSGPITFEYDDDATVGAGNIAVQTVDDLVTAINDNFTTLEARLTDNGELIIESNTATANVTTSGNLAGAGVLDMADRALPTLGPGNTTAVIDTTNNGDGNVFPPTNSSIPENTQGWWEITVVHPDGTELTRGVVNFAGDGTLNASPDINGRTDIMLENIDWGNGSALQDISIDIERFSQFSGNYDVIFSDQNGAELGLRTGVEIDRDGKVVARFSNGASAELYQVPLITFANANGLTEVSGTAYSETEESGEENLRQAGTGGAGFVEPSTLEASNVDLADEFARLIISQRAFGAGTRVINTVDQMTEDLLRLR